jgi:mono/diheme cytochrome c family protein
MAAIWMDDQQSYKAYEAPVLAPPSGAVPVSGGEAVSWQAELKNPVAPTERSLSQGKTLFDINCAMCHGHTPAERGPVGKKLVPPPPGLDHDLVRSRSDSHIFKAITLGFGRMPPFQHKPRRRSGGPGQFLRTANEITNCFHTRNASSFSLRENRRSISAGLLGRVRSKTLVLDGSVE